MKVQDAYRKTDKRNLSQAWSLLGAKKSVIRARAFIDGYRLASLDNVTVGSDSKVLHRFRDFVFEQYRPMSSAGWDEVLLQNSANDAEAFDIFCDLWNRFLSVTESTDL